MAEKAASKKSTAKEKGGAAKGGKVNLTLIIVLVVGLVGGVFAGKTFLGGGQTKVIKVKEKEKVGETLELGDEFVVNLDGEHYLKASVALGLKEGVSAEELKEKEAALRDAVIMTFFGKSKEEIRNGGEKIKDEIKEKLNHLLEEETEAGETVLEVYFRSFAMQ